MKVAQQQLLCQKTSCCTWAVESWSTCNISQYWDFFKHKYDNLTLDPWGWRINIFFRTVITKRLHLLIFRPFKRNGKNISNDLRNLRLNYMNKYEEWYNFCRRRFYWWQRVSLWDVCEIHFVHFQVEKNM